jgi:beta-galactosidase
LDRDVTERFAGRLVMRSGVRPAADVRAGIEVVRRVGERGSYLFVINHTDASAHVNVHGMELLTGIEAAGGLEVGAGEIAVIRERAATRPGG